MKLSVLLAVYNGEAWLPAQLDSLRAQTDPDFTVLLQDDGSADTSPGILEEAVRSDGRFRFAAEQGRRLGAPGNFLSLMRQTDADACLLCDQDDIWEADKIAVMRQALYDAEKSCGSDIPLLIHSDCSVIDADGRSLFPSLYRHQGWDPAAVTLPKLLVQNNVTGCALIINRPLLDLVLSRTRADVLFMHDWWLALTAASFGKVLYLSRPLVRYRQHGTNAMGASAGGQLSRGLQALSRSERARQRVALTYSHAGSFFSLYQDLLPPDAARVIRDYLSTRSLPRLSRVYRVFRQGCTMQSPVTRLGQMLFG